MPEKIPRYLSYLVRLWRVREKRGWQWRGSLENPGDGERTSFPDLDSLIAFLREQTAHQEQDRRENISDLNVEDE